MIDMTDVDRNADRRRVVALELDSACRDYGFFYVLGHGIEAATIETLLSLSRTFFALDESIKRRIHMSLGGRAWRGYFGVGDELTSGVADNKEGIYFGTELDETDRRVQLKWPLHGRNQFPEFPELRKPVLDYMELVGKVAQRLLALLATVLNLPANLFAERFTAEPTILFRIFNYPGKSTSQGATNEQGVGAHTDYGLLTILAQDEIGGLQVLHGKEWLEVPPVPGALVCNVGDMLERLTNGRYLSALHRVQNLSALDRISMSLFFDPSFDAKLLPIDSVRRENDAPHTHVRWDAIDPNAHVGTYGEYLLGKVAKVFPMLGRDVL